MNNVGPLWRSLALAGLMISSAGPAFAAPADVELLKSYIGSWKGRGTLTGAESETVVCKLDMSAGNQDKVNYTGRCTLAGTNLTIAGTIAYVEASKRYEAVMSSDVTFSGVAIGKKQGGGLVFNLKERETEQGEDWTITAQISLNSGDIQVQFLVVDNKTGDSLKAQVPFTKS